MTLRIVNGKLLLGPTGKLATSDACCCGQCSGPCETTADCATGCVCVDGQCVPGGACCLSGGACSAEYTDQTSCEECVTTYTCEEYLELANPEDPCPEGWLGSGGFCYRTTSPASCEDCAGYCSSQETGACGTWVPGGDCASSPCCASGEDCPTYDPACPSMPMACCDNACAPYSCYPGIWIKLTFTKTSACDPAIYPQFAGIAVGDQFDVVIAGSSLLVCEEFADLSSAPCNTQWRLSRGCVLSNFSFDIVNTQQAQTCADCYGQLDAWSYGRVDPTSATATPPGSWDPCP